MFTLLSEKMKNLFITLIETQRRGDAELDSERDNYFYFPLFYLRVSASLRLSRRD
jgi:hypothetical protein